MEYRSFPDVPHHYSSDIDLVKQSDYVVWVSPKLDGTNITIWDGDDEGTPAVGSHSRELPPWSDNSGAATLVRFHAETRRVLANFLRMTPRLYGEYMVKNAVDTYYDSMWQTICLFAAGAPGQWEWVPLWETHIRHRCYHDPKQLTEKDARVLAVPAVKMTVKEAIAKYENGGSLSLDDVAVFGIDPAKDPKLDTWEGVVLHGPLTRKNGDPCLVKIVNPKYREGKHQRALENRLAVEFGFTPLEKMVVDLLTPERISHRWDALGGLDTFTNRKDAAQALASSLLADVLKEDLAPSIMPIVEEQTRLAPRVRAGEKVRVPDLPNIKLGTVYKAIKVTVYGWMVTNARYPESM